MSYAFASGVMLPVGVFGTTASRTYFALTSLLSSCRTCQVWFLRSPTSPKARHKLPGSRGSETGCGAVMTQALIHRLQREPLTLPVILNRALEKIGKHA